MHVIITCGRKKTGKTTKTAQIIKTLNRKENYILDIYEEYPAKFGIKNSYTGKRNIYDFLKTVKNKTGCCIVFEEARAYMGKLNKQELTEIFEMCQGTRHTNNTVIFVFHAISDISSEIYGRTDYFVLFKTQDFQGTLDNKFRKNEQFMENFNEVKNSSDNHFFKIFEVL